MKRLQNKRGRVAISKKIHKDLKLGIIDVRDMEKSIIPAKRCNPSAGHKVEKIRLKIDDRTSILINPGEDPVKAREKYLSKYSKN